MGSPDDVNEHEKLMGRDSKHTNDQICISTAEVDTTITRRDHKRLKGWRFGILTGSLTAFFVLLLNLVVTLVATSGQVHKALISEPTVLYGGDCNVARNMDLGIHLMINILSTLLLSASNYCMQCLSAPTRKEVDKMHSRRKWMDIGVLSIRNLGRISRKRVILWVLLGFSSLPLHLFYNSAVFSSIMAQDYYVFSAYESMVSKDSSNTTLCVAGTTYPVAGQLYSEAVAGQLVRLENQDCIKQYATTFQANHRDLILVTKVNGSAGLPDPYLYSSFQNLLQNTVLPNPYGWICGQHHAEAVTQSTACSTVLATVDASNWKPLGLKVDYCLARSVTETCKLQFSLPLAAIVIVFNFLKVVLFMLAYIVLKENPLLTIGDAVSSFLQRSDDTTKSLCFMSKETVDIWENQSHRFYVDKIEPRALDTNTKRWANVVSGQRWSLLILLYLVAIGVCTGLLFYGLYGQTGSPPPSSLLRLGFGAVNPESLIYWHLPSQGAAGLAANVLIANSPQIILSMIYFTYNSLFTCFALGQEWNSYSKNRKGLRVSKSHNGSQRSTYYLQLPYRVALPLMALSALLHWLVSQSIFLVSINIDVVNNAANGQQFLEAASEFITCGYSPSGILATISVAATMICVAVVTGRKRFAESGMPIVGSCSAAISAACHLPDNEDGNIATELPLQWGQTSADVLESEVGHCSFSSREVSTPVRGRLYAG